MKRAPAFDMHPHQMLILFMLLEYGPKSFDQIMKMTQLRGWQVKRSLSILIDTGKVSARWGESTEDRVMMTISQWGEYAIQHLDRQEFVN